MVAFIFPGQGSKKRGMGQELFDDVREYQSAEREVDAVLGYSMRELCIEGGDRLKNTKYTQPAMYVVNALHYYKAVEEGERPDYVAGYSLGEYNALLAAGVFDFLTGLRLVKKRGELISQSENGSMAKIIGLSGEMIAKVIKERGLTTIDIANLDSPSQVLISGPIESIRLSGPNFEQAGARAYMPLDVSYAFHSRYMNDAAKAFSEFLIPLSFGTPNLPVVANVTGQLYPKNCASDLIKSLLIAQITQPVQWAESVQLLIRQGVREFKEIGPGKFLTRLVQELHEPSGG